MTTQDINRVSGIRTEIFYVIIIVAVSLLIAFFVGVSYQSTRAMIAAANEQTNTALGVISTHGPTSTHEIQNKSTIDILATSSTSIRPAEGSVDVTEGVNIRLEE